jgi:hypothetical protein
VFIAPCGSIKCRLDSDLVGFGLNFNSSINVEKKVNNSSRSWDDASPLNLVKFDLDVFGEEGQSAKVRERGGRNNVLDSLSESLRAAKSAKEVDSILNSVFDSLRIGKSSPAPIPPRPKKSTRLIQPQPSSTVSIRLPPKSQASQQHCKCYSCGQSISVTGISASNVYNCPSCFQSNLYDGRCSCVKPPDTRVAESPCGDCGKMVSTVNLVIDTNYICPHCNKELRFTASRHFEKVKNILLPCCFCGRHMDISSLVDSQKYSCPFCNSEVLFSKPCNFKGVKDNRPILKRLF